MLFSPLRHRIASVVAVEHLFGRAPQDVFEFSIEFAADRGHLLVANLPRMSAGTSTFFRSSVMSVSENALMQK